MNQEAIDLWKHNTTFLREKDMSFEWTPADTIDYSGISEEALELKQPSAFKTGIMLGSKDRDITTRFSTFSPLVRSSAYAFRFIRRTRKRDHWLPVNCIHPRADPDNDWKEIDNEGRAKIVNKRFCLMSRATKKNKALIRLIERVDHVSKLEFEVARQFWIRYGQFTGFPQEIQSLISGDKVDPKSWVAPLQPYLDRTNLVRL